MTSDWSSFGNNIRMITKLAPRSGNQNARPAPPPPNKKKLENTTTEDSVNLSSLREVGNIRQRSSYIFCFFLTEGPCRPAATKAMEFVMCGKKGLRQLQPVTAASIGPTIDRAKGPANCSLSG